MFPRCGAPLPYFKKQGDKEMAKKEDFDKQMLLDVADLARMAVGNERYSLGIAIMGRKAYVYVRDMRNFDSIILETAVGCRHETAMEDRMAVETVKELFKQEEDG